MSKIKPKIFDTTALGNRINNLPSDELTDYLGWMNDLLHIMQTDLDEERNLNLRTMLHDYMEILLCEAEEEQESEKGEINCATLEYLIAGKPTIKELKNTLNYISSRSESGDNTKLHFDAGHNNISVEAE